MATLNDMKTRWKDDADYRQAYAALEDEFQIARALIDARKRAGLTQEALAARIHTTQSAVARMESGKQPPSTRTLQRYAEATGSRLVVSFEPRP